MTEIINGIGRGFCDYAAAMFIQVNVLIVVLLGVDLFLRNRIRATLRYWIWMLVFVKLLLPPSLCVPTGIGYWLGRNELLTPSGSSRPIEAVAAPVRMELETPIETPPVQESRPFPLTVEPAQAVSVAAERLVWQGGVFLLWGAGVSVFAALVIQRLLFVRGLIAHTEPARSDLTDVLDECRRRMGIRRSVGLRLSSGAFSPAVCGLFRPTILMPAAMLDRLSPEGLRAVLIHELAHVKRGDLWVNTLQTVLQIVYFYNPLVWLANAIVRRVREQAVDEMVLVALDAQARSYGNTLIDIAEMAFLRASPALRLIGVAESRKSLEGRIKHMMTRPIPKSARVGALGVLAVAVTGAVLLPMARAQSRTAPEADGEYKILLLDDRDDQYDGKYVYDDRLYLMDSKGRVEGAVTGFNISQAAGGCHVLAVDEKGKTLWVVENVGGRLWHFDLANGKLLHQVSLPHINAAAVDPVTGNVWCTISGEFIHEGRLQVVSPTGEMLMTYPIPGYDIACSDLDDSFWVVGKTVSRVSKDGRVLSQTAGEVSWLAVSVSVDQKTGTAWVVVRDHPDIPGSRPELWAVDKNARIQQQIDLGDLLPYCVVVDSGNGIVWIGCLGVTLRYTTQGEKLKSARYASGTSVAPGVSRDSVIAAGDSDLVVATVADTGRVEIGAPPREVRDLLSSSQKWVAKVPWAGVKLASSPELASLTMDSDANLKLGDYPESAKRLGALGTALLMYANDYEDRLPDVLEGVRPFVSEADMRWLQDNVEYVGKGKTLASRPDVAVAYDKTILDKGVGTLVLYIDSRVAFEGPHKLKTLGIETVTSETISHSERSPDEAARAESAERLAALGKAALIYTIDHEKRLPDRIDDLSDESGLAKSWLVENVTYLGRGIKTHCEPDTLIAYDKTLLLAGHGTNVLRLDTQVVFEPPGRLKELVAIALRAASRTQLTSLGKSLLTYAKDHQDKYPDTLDEARDYINKSGDFDWVLANVTYLGKGGTPREEPGRVLAYSKTLQEQGKDTIVLYRDCHVELVPASRLSEHGL